jgi:hypothetical protein
MAQQGTTLRSSVMNCAGAQRRAEMERSDESQRMPNCIALINFVVYTVAAIYDDTVNIR